MSNDCEIIDIYWDHQIIKNAYRKKGKYTDKNLKI